VGGAGRCYEYGEVVTGHGVVRGLLLGVETRGELEGLRLPFAARSRRVTGQHPEDVSLGRGGAVGVGDLAARDEPGPDDHQRERPGHAAVR
jgi:hypothetical protein